MCACMCVGTHIPYIEYHILNSRTSLEQINNMYLCTYTCYMYLSKYPVHGFPLYLLCL